MKRLRNLSGGAGWDEDKDINKMNQDIIQTETARTSDLKLNQISLEEYKDI